MTLPLNLSLFTHVLNSKTVTGDLNELTTSGFYYVQQPTNSPTTTWVHVIVNASDDKKHIIQLVLPDNGSEGLYYRDRTSGSWSSWNQLATMDQVTNELTRLLTTVEF
ncbi:pyocin knob domain-containing protein [Ligilactobacillus sp.]|uniref:pyocin knob domain-containing protein n=1 Tax=Ligilactobacillus sp. TaxID=2767921 RepID=UPI002FE057F4